MLATLADDDVPACAMTEAGLTHHDPLAGDVAAAVRSICRFLIRGIAWERAVRQSAEERRAETNEALLSVRHGAGTSGGFAPEVLRAAVYFVGSSSRFSEALQQSLAFAGPAKITVRSWWVVSQAPVGEVQRYLLQPWPISKYAAGRKPAQTGWLRAGA
jgi:hypothetical protein